jgi:hypothetical protein
VFRTILSDSHLVFFDDYKIGNLLIFVAIKYRFASILRAECKLGSEALASQVSSEYESSLPKNNAQVVLGLSQQH